MEVEITVQAGEGGQDARLLVARQMAIYVSYAKLHHLSVHDGNNTGS